jgi:hypothetical protein
MKTRIVNLGTLAAAGLLLCLAGCTINPTPTGPMETETRSVKAGEAKSVRVHLKMGAGELKVAGGAVDMVDAVFTYNVPSWKPQVDYTVRGGQGDLTIRQPEGSHGTMGNVHYTWDLHFNGSIPMDMSVEMGAGEANLTLGTLALHNLEVKLGAGKTVVDLAGNWKNDVTAEIRGGVGEATVKLPRDVGVQVYAKGGIGEVNTEGLTKKDGAYVNEAYGKSDVTVKVDVRGGVGQINLRVAEPPPVI